METETAKSWLQFSAALLSFATVAIVTINPILTRLQTSPNKERIKGISLEILKLLLLLGATVCSLRSGLQVIGVCLYFIWMVFSEVQFLRSNEPLTRRSLVFDCLLPLAMFAMVFGMLYTDAVAARIQKH